MILNIIVDILILSKEVIIIPYIDKIKLGPGETSEDSIDVYLDLRLKGLTESKTKLELNDVDYPIGYFDEETIDVFKQGLTTVQNLHALLGHGVKPSDENYKASSNNFADKVIAAFNDNPYQIKSIIESFDEVMMDSSEVHMFDEEDRRIIQEQIEELNNNSAYKK